MPQEYRYKKGDKCSNGSQIREILGQSALYCVYTTEDDCIRWDYFGEGGTPHQAMIAIAQFDYRIAQLKSTSGIPNRVPLFEFLGTCLFRALDTGGGEESVAQFWHFDELLRSMADSGRLSVRVNLNSRNVFLVHGHDAGAKEAAARLILQLGFTPVVLHEQANNGATIIEKFEKNSDVRFAVVLLTPDDVGKAKAAKKTAQRARQNVVFELGYFCAALGRDNVVALVKDDIEIPSDYLGVVYVPIDSNGAWKLQLAKEMKSSGMNVDLNNVH